MPKKTSDQDVLIVDGVEYSWEYRHGWGVDYRFGIRGASVSVWLHRDRTCELILDFPFSTFGSNTPPRRAHLLPHITEGIHFAVDAGWEPESRGRAFRYLVPDSNFTHSRK